MATIPANGNVLEKVHSTAAATVQAVNPAQITSPYLLMRDMYCPEMTEAIVCDKTTGRIRSADWVTDICRTIW